MAETATLDASTAVPYLRRHGVVDGDAEASSLGGGVSNAVVRVDAGAESYVLKQPHPNLRVADDWPADVSRVHNEAAAARAYADVVERAGIDDVVVPEVVFESREDHVIVVTCAPDEATMWKRDLLAGRVDAGVAASLGRFLGTAHRLAAGTDDVRASFRDKTPFDQLRVDPYHRTTADRHPDLAEPVLAEAERVLAADRTLVHGDYSPKNVLVADDLWVLDFEVAHWGDPAFDAAFMLNHLFIKSIHVADARAALRRSALAFWRRYEAAVEWDVERETVAELSVLMLARVDGKSPVEYADETTRARLREVATRGLRGEAETVDGFADLVREACA
ncbi:phosphotransferase family protein [Halomarina pelagica]|uniref:phosphotransferase family protein n=1 Tax=Halomarina pelagica TaxID=2961599 RepID=UPI0020C4D365|nr:aminoglycoside phosphotransferase family protein [Halomarina sp. BND7]